ncbi:hypothetical protein TRVL_10164 [Trypanosoma vivax]|nr:hypothetical protein TRVL_10164 [Trypanosoma vivax]
MPGAANKRQSRSTRCHLLCVDGRLALRRHLACLPSLPSGAPRRIPQGAPSPRSASKQRGLRGCDRPRARVNRTKGVPLRRRVIGRGPGQHELRASGFLAQHRCRTANSPAATQGVSQASEPLQVALWPVRAQPSC